MDSKKSLVYFVEDDPNTSYVIKKTLLNLGLNSKEFNNGKDFLKSYSKLKPDLILLDIMLPDCSGIDLLKHIRQKDNNILIIIVSALTSEIDIVNALDLGADDYITKPFSVLEFRSRIKASLRTLSPKLKYNIENLNIDISERIVVCNDNLITFTKKEFDLLVLLLKNQNQVLSKEEIFLNVWNKNYNSESRTLDIYIKKVREKLKKAGSNIEIKTIFGIGYKI